MIMDYKKFVIQVTGVTVKYCDKFYHRSVLFALKNMYI